MGSVIGLLIERVSFPVMTYIVSPLMTMKGINLRRNTLQMMS
jgi:hypothetical protein